jgi:hypothetical protein
MTGSERLARNSSPGELCVVLTPSIRETRSLDPPGMVTFPAGIISDAESAPVLSDDTLVHAVADARKPNTRSLVTNFIFIYTLLESFLNLPNYLL